MKKCLKCEKTKEIGEFSLNPAKRDGVYSVCASCRGEVCHSRKNNKSIKKKQEFLGPRCATCDKPLPAENPNRTCPVCKERKAQYYKKIAESPELLEKRREYNRKYKERLRAGKETTGIRERKKNSIPWVQRMKQQGLCVSCGKARDTEYLRCSHCLDRYRKNYQKIKECPDLYAKHRELTRDYVKKHRAKKREMLRTTAAVDVCSDA